MTPWPRHPAPLFYCAAAWNFAAGASGLLATALSVRIFYGVVDPEPLVLLISRLFWLNVVVMGGGYALIARAPGRDRTLIGVALVSKALEFFAWGALAWTGEATGWAALAGTGNLVFALLFLRFLLGQTSGGVGGRSAPGGAP